MADSTSSSDFQIHSGSESSDESISRSSRHCKRLKVPTKASDWKMKDLSEIGIHYNDTALGLHDFMSLIKKDLKCQFDLPDISKKLIQLTNDILVYSIDLAEPKRENIMFGIKTAGESISSFKSSDIQTVLERQELEINEKALEIQDDCMPWARICLLRIYEVWKGSILYFWANLRRFLTIFYHKDGQREASFTSLFMQFSRVCLLDPDTGKAYPGSKKVKGTEVRSLPDVRFNLLPEDGQLLLLTLTQVKKEDAFEGDFKPETFCFKNIADKVLGQHGIELVVEAKDSYFNPRVSGIICVGTKIIFTWLDISYKHLKMIEDNRTTDMKATINYTRPYDFLDLYDRKEIYDSLFWFGYVQSNSYKTFVS